MIPAQQLPRPDHNRTGWPWEPVSDYGNGNQGPDSDWPRISIVTPSFNQGRYIEQTIRSVLLQDYPNLEYIVIDGGSSDDTIHVLRKYDRWLTDWVSEPDRGQSHALNKGFSRATGDILAYINSDDWYEPGILTTVAETFNRQADCQLVAGKCLIVEDGRPERCFEPWWPPKPDHLLLPFGSPFAQPASFWSKAVFKAVGGFDESLHYILDREFFLKQALEGVCPVILEAVVCRYRVHPGIKTNQTARFYRESIPVIRKYARAAGLSGPEEQALLKSVTNELGYLETFETWKQRGRLKALLRFGALVARSPELLQQRKILGLGRRLLMFPAAAVPELNNPSL